MLIIFVLALLVLLAVAAMVIGLPLLIVVAMVRSRHRNGAETIVRPSDSDAEFVALVNWEWPQELSSSMEPTLLPADLGKALVIAGLDDGALGDDLSLGEGPPADAATEVKLGEGDDHLT